MKRKSTEVFIVEEHHEAYLVWKYARVQGLIPIRDNTLLHIDEHSDMASPVLNTSLNKLNGDLRRIKKFIYRELNIASFIVPAIYDRLFSSIYWIRQRHNKTSPRATHCYVRSVSNKGRKLITQQKSLLELCPNDYDELKKQIVHYRFYKQHVEQMASLKNPILDIDLDYFSCVQDPSRKGFFIEITKSEFERFNQQVYHRIRFFDSGRVEAKKEKGKYYYHFNHFQDEYTSPLKVDRKKILERIKNTVAALKQRVGLPGIITICRSKFSGFTPEDQCEFIEVALLSELKKIYPIERVTHISQLV